MTRLLLIAAVLVGAAAPAAAADCDALGHQIQTIAKMRRAGDSQAKAAAYAGRLGDSVFAQQVQNLVGVVYGKPRGYHTPGEWQARFVGYCRHSEGT